MNAAAANEIEAFAYAWSKVMKGYPRRVFTYFKAERVAP
jgi:hypothetical protein